MVQPLHHSEYTASPDGTIELRGLEPGQRVRVVVAEAEALPPEWGPGSIPGSMIYRPDLPRKAWGSLAEPGFEIIDPFEPACDPDDWEALR